MLPEVVALLTCPNCQGPLSARADGAVCPQGHAFDQARQGYLSLLQPQALTSSGDDAGMVEARDRFLGAGHYAALRARIAGVAGDLDLPSGALLDLGAGTGYYAAAALEALPGRFGLAIDTSKAALRRAARAHPRLGAVAADAWQRLPVGDKTVALSLVVFAPRNSAELARVSAPGAMLMVVTPGPGHLREIREPLQMLGIQQDKADRLHDALDADFTLTDTTALTAGMSLSRAEVETLVGMGPSARHRDPTAWQSAVQSLAEPSAVTAEFQISLWSVRRG